jgi:hypothetical protein
MLDEVIADFLGGYPPYQAVLRLPGIGPVLAAVVIAEIGDVRRFPGPGQLCSWAGLTPRHRESDAKVARGHITKQGSPVLRWATVEAIGASPPAARPASSRTPSSTAVARRPGTSPRSRRPASCSPASSTRSATGRSGPWRPAAQQRPREQARTRAARDRLQVWPPPPGGAAAALIDPAARRRPPHAPAANRPREPRRDDRSQAPATDKAAPWGRNTTAYRRPFPPPHYRAQNPS